MCWLERIGVLVIRHELDEVLEIRKHPFNQLLV
jgi:hypothetical protein